MSWILRVAISSRSESVSVLRDDRMRARSPSLSASSRCVKRGWPRSWLTSRNPPAAATSATATRPAKRGNLPPEDPAPDGGEVLEDANAEDDDDRGDEVDVEAVADPHQPGRDQRVGDKGEDEDAVV